MRGWPEDDEVLRRRLAIGRRLVNQPLHRIGILDKANGVLFQGAGFGLFQRLKLERKLPGSDKSCSACLS